MDNQTPQQEASSIITIAAVMIAAACYAACMDNVPIVAPALFNLAKIVYGVFPQLYGMKSPQIPMLAAAGSAGSIAWLLGMPFTGLLAKWFSMSQLANMDRQTRALKRNRARIEKARRARDSFDVN